MNAPNDLRRTFIGGSDAAAILGLSPWATPLGIYRRKRGEVADDFELDPQKARILRRGKLMEPVVLKMLEAEHGIRIVKRSSQKKPNRYAMLDYPFLAAEIDAEWKVKPEDAERWNLDPSLIGTVQNIEVKTVHPFAAGKYGEEFTDEIPVEYGAQAMHGLMVTGRRLTLVAVLVGSDNLVVYFVKRDDETIDGMRAKEVAFWNEHVLAGVPPAPQDILDVYALFKRDLSTKIEASIEVAALVEDLKRANDEERAAKERAEEIKFRVGEFMLGAAAITLDPKDGIKPGPEAKPGRHVLTFGGDEILTVALQSQARIDQKLLREQHPEVAEQCTKQSQFFTFRAKRSKR